MEAEQKKLELAAQAEQRKMEAQAQAEQRKMEAQAEERKIQAQAEQRKMELAARAEERKLEAEDRKIAVQTEERRVAAQTEERKLEAQERMRTEDRKLEELKLEIERKRVEGGDFRDISGRDNTSFKFAHAIKFVPKFDTTDIEHYLLSFEKAMSLHKIQKENWTVLLHPQLNGKAAKVFAELSGENCTDYDVVKQALLTAYERVPEFYRKKFRTMTKESRETYSNYAFRLQMPFQRWLEGEEAVADIKRLCEVFKLEQFIHCLPPELHKWIVDKHPLTLSAAAKLADEYAVLYKQMPVEDRGMNLLVEGEILPKIDPSFRILGTISLDMIQLSLVGKLPVISVLSLVTC